MDHRAKRKQVTERHRSESGVIGGAESLAFGVLILVVGALLIVQSWAVIETKTALDDAGREFLRTYTEQPDPVTATAKATRAARSLLVQRGTPLRGLRLIPPDATRFGPCAIARVQISATVPALRLPFGLRFGAVTTASTTEELIDSHREVIIGPRYNPTTTPCA